MDFSFFGKKKKEAGNEPAAGAGAAGKDSPSTDGGSKAAAAGADAPKRDPRKAKRWFEHARNVADTRNYDFAIECYINGIKFEPNMKAHEGLREVALKRKVSGGKPPGLTEQLHIGGSKDPVERLARAEHLWAKDPTNPKLALGVMERASEVNDANPDMEMQEVVHWFGEKILDSAGGSAKTKIDKATYVKVTDLFHKIGSFEKAAEACTLAIQLSEDDPELLTRLKDLEAERTIAATDYKKGDDFRSKIKDADEQKRRETEDQVGATDVAKDQVIAARKAEYEADPKDIIKLKKLADALRQKGSDAEDEQAWKLLLLAHQTTNQFQYKVTAGDVRMRMLGRQFRGLRDKVAANPQDAAAKAQFEELRHKILDYELQEYTERVTNYPTDLTLRFQLGYRLYLAKKYDEAISALQEAQADAKQRARSLQYLGQCYNAKGYYDEAVQTFRRGIESHKLEDDPLAMDLRYLLMDSLEAAARKNKSLEQARESEQLASKLFQTNIGFRDIRQRLDKLRNLVVELQKAGA